MIALEDLVVGITNQLQVLYQQVELTVEGRLRFSREYNVGPAFLPTGRRQDRRSASEFYNMFLVKLFLDNLRVKEIFRFYHSLQFLFFYVGRLGARFTV